MLVQMWEGQGVPRRSMQPSGTSGSSDRSSAAMSVPMSRPYAPVSSDVSHTWTIDAPPISPRRAVCLCFRPSARSGRSEGRGARSLVCCLVGLSARASVCLFVCLFVCLILLACWFVGWLVGVSARASVRRSAGRCHFLSNHLLHALVLEHAGDPPADLGGLVRAELAALNTPKPSNNDGSF